MAKANKKIPFPNSPQKSLIVYKTDLSNDKTISNEEIEEKYISQFANIFFTSAYTGEGVDETFTQSGRLGLEYSSSVQETDNKTKNIDMPIQRKKKEGCC